MNTDEFQKKIIAIRPQLVQKAKQWTEHDDEAEDMVQEVLLRLWITRAQWENHPNFEALAFKTLKNKNIDRFRTHKNTVEKLEDFILATHEQNPHQHTETNDTMKLLTLIIEHLPDLQRMIIRLKDVEGYEIEEIVKITNASPDAVRMNLSRARKKVKDLFLKYNTL